MKIGIVSSWSDLCGNASYTRALKNEFEKQGHDVHVFDLPSRLFNTEDSGLSKEASKLIDKYCQEIPSYDYINLQIEQALYGKSLKQAAHRMLALMDACKEGAFSITLHSVPSRIIQKKQKGIRKIKTYLKKIFKKSRYEKVIYDLILKADKKRGLVIVHNEREKYKILSLCPNIRVSDYPLMMFNEPDVREFKKQFSKEDFAKKYSLPFDKKIIGCFGFPNENKGFETAINAMSFLPPEYVLYIFGGQHHLTFTWQPKGSSYIQKLVELVISLGLQDRVFFMGAQNDDDAMRDAMCFCNYVVLPYLEIGQNASAVASMGISFADNLFLSRTECFKEFSKYTGKSFFSFDMGNYLELVQKIKTLPEKEEISKNRLAFFERYNVTGNVHTYLEGQK